MQLNKISVTSYLNNMHEQGGKIMQGNFGDKDKDKDYRSANLEKK